MAAMSRQLGNKIAKTNQPGDMLGNYCSANTARQTDGGFTPALARCAVGQRGRVACFAGRTPGGSRICVMPDGRLANPDCSLGTDPRSDPRMVEAFTPFGLDALLPQLPVSVDSPLD